jgi:hypothetical protein
MHPIGDVTPGLVVAGQYELLRELGTGSFGRTFLAHDRAADRDVAIKLLDPRAIVDWKSFDRFEREAAALHSLRHQGIPEVYGLIRDEGQGTEAAYLVMEYVEGASLETLIEEGRQLDPTDVFSIFVEVLAILEYLHARVPPILHRDIKPANIMLRPNGMPALVDFGSVRRVYMSPDESGSTIAGTYGYMPYEQYMGQASPASDLYALGATFLHLLAGRPPRDFMTQEGRIEVPEALPGDHRMGPIIARMLRPSPADRFQSAREVRQSLLSPTTVALTTAHMRTATSIVPAALLAPTPRVITGDTARLLDKVAPSALQLTDGSAKSAGRPGLFGWASLAFLSVLSAGVLPMVFISMARARRRRLRRFLRDGQPATAEILNIEIEKIAFDRTLARVTYQFPADGLLRRDTDHVLPVIAGRWMPGDSVPVLYLPEHDYDSVIISTG